MKSLAIDVGNTNIKVGVFNNNNLINVENVKSIDADFVKEIIKNKKIEFAIISSVKLLDRNMLTLLQKECFFIEMEKNTLLPINNLYHTRDTLGMDRLAGVVGASAKFPKKNILVVDAGTCITYDFINSKKEYIGGAISPGIEMRFKALNNFTDALPLIDKAEVGFLIGKTTEESIKSGVVNGVRTEVDQIINKYKELFDNLYVIFCGGDIIYFDKKIKNRIFALENLVLYGLNEILNYNVEFQRKK